MRSNLSSNAAKRCNAVIDLAAFRHNLQVVRKAIAPACRIMAVVKADAYGHGMIKCARAAVEVGAEALGVATLAEAVALRNDGRFSETPILIMAPTLAQDADEVQRLDLGVSVGTSELLTAHLDLASRRERRARIHIQIDSGIGRDGFRFDDLSWLDIVTKHPQHFEGLFHHFAVADGVGEGDISFTNLQCDRFDKIVAEVKTRSLHPIVHAANSAAVLRHPRAHYDMVRPGIMLYGAEPSDSPELCPDLKPVCHLHSVIAAIKSVKAGDSVSYGRMFVASRPTRIAVVNIGYGDGYPRKLSNRFDVLIRGRRAPICGRVCMDQLMVDLSTIPDAVVGDQVTLYGVQGDQCIRLEEAAHAAETISYELTCILTNRAERTYINETTATEF